MAEQFDMSIYNAVLTNGFYVPPSNTATQQSNIQYVGDSKPLSNIVYMTESFNPHNIEYSNFSNKEKK